jgi:hypothetical protein
MSWRPAPPRCRCGCNELAPQGNAGGFASKGCYLLWAARQSQPIDDARITTLRRGGMSLEAIAKTVGRSEGAIRRRLHTLGVAAPERPPPATPKRVHRWTGQAPPAIKRSSVPWARVGTYQHPPLGPWTFGCPCCAARILGPMVAS